MATSPTSSGERSEHLLDLSNEELGEIWAQTIRAHALRRTGSTRNFWRKVLDEPDVIGLHAEFRRRALERQEEYDAWLQWRDASPL